MSLSLQAETRLIHKDITFVVEPPEEGLRLDRFLMGKLRGLSRNRVSSLIRNELTGPAAKPGRRVRAGETYVIRYPKKIKTEPDFPLEKVFEDEHLLVVNKPAGQLVHPTRTSVKNTLIDIIRAGYEDVADVRPSLAHRLDRETSGLLVVTKNADVSRRIGFMFLRREVRKTYRAIVVGQPRPSTGRISIPIGPDTDSKVDVKQKADPLAGYPACTAYEVESAFSGFSLLRLMPETGRLHQLRVHLSSVGHPLVGDKIYGPSEELYLEFIEKGFTASMKRRLLLHRHALHASCLDFVHPVTGKRVSLEAPLPVDMREFMESKGMNADSNQDPDGHFRAYPAAGHRH